MRRSRWRRAIRIALIVAGGIVAAILLLVIAKFGSTAPPTAVVESATAGPPAIAPGHAERSPASIGVSLPELVYFGAAWQMLNRDVGMAPIILGGGFTNARIERTRDGRFFAGTVDRVDRNGAVTDVVLAFAGAQGIGDLIQGEALAHDRVLGVPKWAAALLERIWSDPRYARAHIHVTGHSLGAGYAQFSGTEAIARHGLRAVSARVDIVVFGTPNWGVQSARYFHVSPHVLDRIFTAYTALNDPVITNGGTERVGVSRFLPAFTGLSGARSIFNPIAAHWPTTYMSALGLPDWLTPEQKSAFIRRVSSLFITGNSYDPHYGRNADFDTVGPAAPAVSDRSAGIQRGG